ncbi:TPM domain-containing protein [Marinigracilibium pacificum]|uniref:TPM domain-containing protein n=1 Tax=Marinigracilibium pacificum TaxID=2729599 RepID=A0A848IWH0_9BACT|nr:TPM domain-containing protein [Marinigracilibium pacificum]NMM48677.1 TPM domain-containing protein [Marinigracilibium pacificum]
MAGKLGLYLLFILFSFSTSAQIKGYVFDNAELLKKKDFSSLEFFMRGINEDNGPEYVFYSINNLLGEDINEVSRRLYSNLIGRNPYIDNGVLYVYSKEDNQFALTTGEVLKWHYDKAFEDSIINISKSYFSNEDYFNGLSKTFTALYDKFNNQINWNTSYNSFTELGNDLGSSEGKLVEFIGIPLTKNFTVRHDPKVYSSDEYYIRIKGDNGKVIRLFYTLDMLDDIESVINSSQVRIIARVGSLKPFKFLYVGKKPLDQ